MPEHNLNEALHDKEHSGLHANSRIATIAAALVIVGASVAPGSAIAAINTSDALSGTPSSQIDEKYVTRLPDIAAKQAIVVANDGTEVYARNADAPIKIASMTKLMTALVASKYPDDTIVTVTKSAADTPGSTANILAGDEITLGELYKGLMLPSGNDAAYAIAYSIGGELLKQDGGNQDDQSAALARFVKEMNDTAASFGMSGTLFSNPCGLDDDGYEGDMHSTARDVAKLGLEFMKNQTLSSIVAQKEADMIVTRNGQQVAVKEESTDQLIGSRGDALGIKTGHTDEAGYCFVGAYNSRAGNGTVTVTCGDSSYEEVFKDTETLWDWANNSWQKYDLVDSLQTDENTGKKIIGSLAVPEWNDKRVKGVVSDDVTYSKWFWQSQPADYSIESDVPDGAITEGDDIGDIVFRDSDGKEIARANILAAENVDEPGILDRISIFFSRLLDKLTDVDTRAKDQFSSIGAAKQITSEEQNAAAVMQTTGGAVNNIQDNTLQK